MRKIVKGNEPEKLAQWKIRNPVNVSYEDLTDVERLDIRESCLAEQYFICAYCCQTISGKNRDCMNEHVVARKIAPHRSLDYTNIVSSCTAVNQCDASHGSQALPLTPLMDECETELVYSISGRISGTTQRAKDSIKVLNLGDTEQNNKSLIEKRKQFVISILLTNGIDPSEGLEDNDLVRMVINDISLPQNGKLEAFSPVAVNVLKQWLS